VGRVRGEARLRVVGVDGGVQGVGGALPSVASGRVLGWLRLSAREAVAPGGGAMVMALRVVAMMVPLGVGVAVVSLRRVKSTCRSGL